MTLALRVLRQCYVRLLTVEGAGPRPVCLNLGSRDGSLCRAMDEGAGPPLWPFDKGGAYSASHRLGRRALSWKAVRFGRWCRTNRAAFSGFLMRQNALRPLWTSFFVVPCPCLSLFCSSDHACDGCRPVVSPGGICLPESGRLLRRSSTAWTTRHLGIGSSHRNRQPPRDVAAHCRFCIFEFATCFFFGTTTHLMRCPLSGVQFPRYKTFEMWQEPKTPYFMETRCVIFFYVLNLVA